MGALKKLPLQPGGWVVFGVGCASLIGALVLNWRELFVLAIGCGAILVISLAFVLGRSEIKLERRLDSDRVSVGDDVDVGLVARNSGGVATGRQIIIEAFDGALVSVPLPGLRAGAETTVLWDAPTDRRGRYRLGPARITKADPCRLMQRNVGQTGVDELWVQPRVVQVPLFVGGLAKDADGPTFDHSPAGDVAFHALREYQTGDDPRHVHWMATARAGTMMVRHYVDNRQPYVTVVLDVDAGSWADDAEFDIGVSIAASIGASALERAQPVTVFAGGTQLVGSQRQSTRQLLLDDLTLVDMVEQFALPDAMGPLITGERNTSVAVVIVGSQRAAASLGVPAARVAQTTSTLVIRVTSEIGNDNAVVAGRGVRYVEATNLDDFAKSIAQRVTAT